MLIFVYRTDVEPKETFKKKNPNEADLETPKSHYLITPPEAMRYPYLRPNIKTSKFET